MRFYFFPPPWTARVVVANRLPSAFCQQELTRKRRASFHGFGWQDRLFLRGVAGDDSIITELDRRSSHNSDYELLDAVRLSPSLDSLVNNHMVDWFIQEANAVDEDAPESSSFSFDLAARAAKYAVNAYSRSDWIFVGVFSSLIFIAILTACCSSCDIHVSWGWEGGRRFIIFTFAHYKRNGLVLKFDVPTDNQWRISGGGANEWTILPLGDFHPIIIVYLIIIISTSGNNN